MRRTKLLRAMTPLDEYDDEHRGGGFLVLLGSSSSSSSRDLSLSRKVFLREREESVIPNKGLGGKNPKEKKKEEKKRL